MLIGQVIGGKYRVTERLGVGGMGTVFEAQHTGTGGKVAIKIIIGAQVKDEAVVRFEREARAAGTVDSRHIIRVFDVGTDEPTGLPYMVMERLSGEDLSSLVRRLGPLRPELAMRIAAQSLLGLAKAHEAGVVHRDIKPANIYLATGDHGEVVVKILDFGIAKVKMDQLQGGADDGALTRTGSMLGSPHYMSPEQAQGLKSIDHRTDIWSMGVVLYKMLTGRTPHQNLEALGQVILAICSQPARPVQEVAPWVERELASVVHGALKSDPDHRYQTSDLMLEAMKPLLHDGWNIKTDMFVPMSDEERAVIAVPLSLGMRAAGNEGAPLADEPSQGSTDAGLANTSADNKPRSRAPMYLGMLAIAAGVVFVGFKVAKPPPPAPAASQTIVTTTAVPTVTEKEFVPIAPKKITAKLKISSSGATAEVDGVIAPIKDGFVELVGEPGTAYKVRVYKGKPDGEPVRVVVVDDGTTSPVSLAAYVKPSAGGPAPKANGASAGGGAPTPTPAPAKASGFTREM